MTEFLDGKLVLDDEFRRRRIVNWLSLWYFKSGGKSRAPLTIRAIIGKGWGQGPQHSKSLHSWFAHLPGLRVAMPATPFDAKGLLMESILGENPTLILESRSLFSMTGAVPEAPYRVKFGRAAIRRTGSDITLLAIGYFVPLALRAAEVLAQEGVSVEVIDPRSISPLDEKSILNSVAKTRRLVVADPGWRSCGMASEVIALVAENLGSGLKSAPIRVTFPDSHTPMSQPLESAYYPGEKQVIDALRKVRG